MKVRFAMSGGVAGLVREIVLDTATLPASMVAEIERLVADSGISTSEEKLSATGRDLEQYEITIDDGQRHVATVYDTQTLPAAARKLVGFLKKQARPAR